MGDDRGIGRRESSALYAYGIVLMMIALHRGDPLVAAMGGALVVAVAAHNNLAP